MQVEKLYFAHCKIDYSWDYNPCLVSWRMIEECFHPVHSSPPSPPWSLLRRLSSDTSLELCGFCADSLRRIREMLDWVINHLLLNYGIMEAIKWWEDDDMSFSFLTLIQGTSAWRGSSTGSVCSSAAAQSAFSLYFMLASCVSLFKLSHYALFYKRSKH